MAWEELPASKQKIEEYEDDYRCVYTETEMQDAIAHLVSELDGMTQRCEELEIELECMRNAFPEHDYDVRPKRRGIF